MSDSVDVIVFNFEALYQQSSDPKPYQLLQETMRFQRNHPGVPITFHAESPEALTALDRIADLRQITLSLIGREYTEINVAPSVVLHTLNIDMENFQQTERILLNVRNALSVQGRPALLADIFPITDGKMMPQQDANAKILPVDVSHEDVDTISSFIKSNIDGLGYNTPEATIRSAASKVSVVGGATFKLTRGDENNGVKLAINNKGAALVYKCPPMTEKIASEQAMLTKRALSAMSSIFTPDAPAIVKYTHNADKSRHYVIAPQELIAKAQELFSVDMRRVQQRV